MRHSCSFFILLYSVTLFSHLSFFFNDTATTEIYTLSLHDALPILTWLNVEQGHLGDCYFAASLSAVLFADKSGALAKKMIVPRSVSGKVVSYYVYFYQASGRRVRIETDIDLLHRTTNGHVLYMRSPDTK